LQVNAEISNSQKNNLNFFKWSSFCQETIFLEQNYPKINKKISNILDNFYSKIWSKTIEEKLNIYNKLVLKVSEFLNKVENKDKTYYALVKIKCSLDTEILSSYKDLIYNYYSNISNYNYQDLEKAYNMKNKPKISFKDFQKLYKTSKKNIYSPSNFKKIWNNIFEFRVDLYEWELGQKWETFKEAYKVTIKIVNNQKLETLTVKKINSEILKEKSFWNNKAILKWENWSKILYVNWKIIKKIDAINNDFFQTQMDIDWLEFLDNWNILKYDLLWYEFGMTYFYNLKNWKILDLKGVYADVYWITSNNKYLYICGENWMWPGWVFIYKVWDFSMVKILSTNVLKCIWYNKNILKYEIYDSKGNILKKEYNFDTFKFN
jgi:hypothetical protein